jgi:hypothetical protein
MQSFGYEEVTGIPLDPRDGYAQCGRFSTVRPNAWTCSPAENAHRLYGEYAALKELLDPCES